MSEDDEVSDDDGVGEDDEVGEMLDVLDAAWEVLEDGGDARGIVARLTEKHGSRASELLAQTCLFYAKGLSDRVRREDRGDIRLQIIAAITENIRRSELDREQQLSGAPELESAAVRAYLERIQVESSLIDDLAGHPNGPEDALSELVSFAATAVEMWAIEAGRNSFELLEQIAKKWTETESIE